MCSCKSLRLLCILPFGILCLSSITMMFVKNYIGGGYVGGYCSLSENRLCVFRKLCPVGLLEVSNGVLRFGVLSYVDCGDDGDVV